MSAQPTDQATGMVGENSNIYIDLSNRRPVEGGVIRALRRELTLEEDRLGHG
jgi:hypothetical protein